MGLALAAVGVGAYLGPEAFGWAWRVAVLFAAYSGVAWLLEKRGLRNPGVSGFLAVADAAALAILIAKFSALGQFGFLVLAPCAFAAARHGSNPAAMAPIATAWLLVAANLTTHAPPSNSLLAQALAVLAVGLLLNQARIVMTVTREMQPTPDPPTEGPEPIHFLELRENFRKLRDYARDLDRKSRRDRSAVKLYEVAFARGERFPLRLAQVLREVSGAEGLSLHSASQLGDLMIVRGTSGDLPDGIETMAFDVGNGLSEYQMKSRLEQRMRALRDESKKQVSGSVMLRDRGRLIGVACLTHENSLRLEEAMARVEEVAEVAAQLLRRHAEQEDLERRLKESETLYGLATIVRGAETAASLAARVVREVVEDLGLQHVAVAALESSEAFLLANKGPNASFVDTIDFGSAKGVAGWLASGAEETVLMNAPDDPRVDRVAALKRRIGSYAVIPLRIADRPYGLLTASTQNAGGLDAPELSTLRIVAAELARALGRLEREARGTEGLATPREFQEVVTAHPEGCLVYLEPVRAEELTETYGRHAMEHVARRLAAKLQGILPPGGLLCRRAEGDLVAYLRDVEEPFARSWANEAAALASMLPLRTPDGRVRIPFGLKAKVAKLGPLPVAQPRQSDRISTLGGR